jgi:hypothetical protein
MARAINLFFLPPGSAQLLPTLEGVSRAARILIVDDEPSIQRALGPLVAVAATMPKPP